MYPQLARQLVEWKPQGQSDDSTAAVHRATALVELYKARKHPTPRAEFVGMVGKNVLITVPKA